MEEIIHRRDTCRLCLSKDIECVLKLKPTPIGEAYISKENLGCEQTKYPVDLVLCKNCGHVQIADVINPKELYQKYIYKTTHSLGLVDHFERYADYVLKTVKPLPGSLVVDIGSNDGSLLRSFKKRELKVVGVDPAEDIAKSATNSGVDTLPKLFNVETAMEIKEKYGCAQIITANNAFANIDNLHEIINGVKELLAPNGIFIFETGYLLDVLQKIIFDNIYHEHLSYFSIKPAQKFFAENGLELIDIHWVQTKGGSIRCSVQLSSGSREIKKNVTKFIELESDLKIHDIETYNAFEKNINQMQKQTFRLIQNLKSKGKKIVGYGASVTVTDILFNFNLDNDLIDFLVDDNPVRHDLYSPGFHIPVYSSEKIYEFKPDYIVVLAWQYAKPIILKHLKYLEEGGNFIVFQPQLKIINKTNYEFEILGNLK